jgi:ComF family protein
VSAAVPAPEGCPECHNARFRFDGVTTLGVYDGLLRDAVLRMKRPRNEPLATAVAGHFFALRGEALRSLGAEIVIAIPMHWTRRVVRTINSPEVLADCLAARLGVPVDRRALRRRRRTLPQKDLSPDARLKNLRGAFRLGGRARLQGKKVLLVDDILTTGATCNEAAKILKQGGAAAVWVAVVARACGP